MLSAATRNADENDVHKYQREFITVYMRRSRNRRRLLDSSLSAREARGHRETVTVSTVTLILAERQPCASLGRAVNYWGREHVN